MSSASESSRTSADTADDDLVAAIDVGTNTVLCLVARSDREQALVVVEDQCVTPRLGSGLARRGTLDPESAQRTEDALRAFAVRLQALRVNPRRTRVVGTAALRRARDGADFAHRIKERVGLEVEILSEQDEARLAHLGAVSGGASEDAIVIDVGGGSTEIVFDQGRQRRSVPIGAVVLTETYLGVPPLEPGGWEGVVLAVQHAFRDCAGARPTQQHAGAEVVLVGGTPMNWACLALGLRRFDLRAADGAELLTQGISEWANRLADLPVDERARFAIERERSEILPAGLACLAGAVEWVGARRARVSGRGLRFGVASELLSGRGRGQPM